jgi:hypothetical protein
MIWLLQVPVLGWTLPVARDAVPCEWQVSPRLNRTGVGDDDPTIIEPMANSASLRNGRDSGDGRFGIDQRQTAVGIVPFP